MNSTLSELAQEFLETAKHLESIAKDYLADGMREQYDILWHEGAVYRYCGLRVQEEIAATEAAGGDGR